MQTALSRFRAPSELASPSNESKRWKRRHDTDISIASTRDSFLTAGYASPRVSKRAAMHSIDNHMSFTVAESQTNVDSILRDMELFQRQLSTIQDINQINQKINQWKELISHYDEEASAKMLELSQESKNRSRSMSNLEMELETKEAQLEKCQNRIGVLIEKQKILQSDSDHYEQKYRDVLEQLNEKEVDFVKTADRLENVISRSQAEDHPVSDDSFKSRLTSRLEHSLADLKEITRESAQYDEECLRLQAERRSEMQEYLEEHRRLVEQVELLSDELQQKDAALREAELTAHTVEEYTRYIKKLENIIETEREGNAKTIDEHEAQVEEISRRLDLTNQKKKEMERRNKELEHEVSALQDEVARLNKEFKDLQQRARKVMEEKHK